VVEANSNFENVQWVNRLKIVREGDVLEDCVLPSGAVIENQSAKVCNAVEFMNQN